jgi:hypothetical protein
MQNSQSVSDKSSPIKIQIRTTDDEALRLSQKLWFYIGCDLQSSDPNVRFYAHRLLDKIRTEAVPNPASAQQDNTPRNYKEILTNE